MANQENPKNNFIVTDVASFMAQHEAAKEQDSGKKKKKKHRLPKLRDKRPLAERVSLCNEDVSKSESGSENFEATKQEQKKNPKPFAPVTEKSNVFAGWDRRKVIISVIGTFLIVALVFAGTPFAIKKLSYDEENLFSYGLIPVSLDGEWGYANKSGELKISCQFSYAGRFDKDGFAVVSVGGKYGVINTNGEFVINPKFDRLDGGFDDEGYMIARKDNKYGFIDRKGEWVIEPIYSRVSAFSEQHDVAVVALSEYIVIHPDIDITDSVIGIDSTIDVSDSVTIDIPNSFIGVVNPESFGDFGIINRKGELKPILGASSVSAFSENGLALVCRDGLYGFIDINGEFVIDPKYAYASQFVNGYACVGKMVDSDIDIDGDGLSDKTSSAHQMKYGCIDSMDTLVVDYQFALPFSFTEEGYAIVTLKSTSGVIDTSGQYVINPRYSYIKSIQNNGLVIFSNDNDFGCFDIKTGEYAVKPRYEVFSLFSERDGLAAVKKGSWGYVNSKGEEVIDFIYTEAGNFNYGLAKVKKSVRYGYIDKYGEVVTDYSFRSAGDFHKDGYAIVEAENNKFGIINKKGEYVIPPIYDKIQSSSLSTGYDEIVYGNHSYS